MTKPVRRNLPPPVAAAVEEAEEDEGARPLPWPRTKARAPRSSMIENTRTMLMPGNAVVSGVTLERYEIAPGRS
jgi:hypothetical protein